MDSLAAKIKAITEKAGGTWGVSIKDMQTGEAWGLNEDLPFTAASVIKVPIMAAIFQGVEEGSYSLSDQISLRAEDQVGGAGVLQHMTAGTKLTIEDLLVLMIIQSDNTATNMMIDLGGIDKIQAFMDRQGMTHSELHNKLMLPPELRSKFSNKTTARDQTLLLAKMDQGELVSKAASESMMAIMKKQQLSNSLPRLINVERNNGEHKGVSFILGHKTGSIARHRHDVGVFYVNDRAMAVSVLSREEREDRLEAGISEIGLAVFRYLLEG